MKDQDQVANAIEVATNEAFHTLSLLGRMVSVDLPCIYHRRLMAMYELYKLKGGEITLSDAGRIETAFPLPVNSEEE